MKEFEVKDTNRMKVNPINHKVSPDQKRKLHQLAVNAIIEDGRSFNDFNKSGITKLFNGLLEGTSYIFSISLIECVSRFSCSSSQHGEKKSETIEHRTQQENDKSIE